MKKPIGLTALAISIAGCTTSEITSVTSDGLTMQSSVFTDEGAKLQAAQGACALYGRRPVHVISFRPYGGGAGDTFACITPEKAEKVGL
ncbi:hypothetical protein SAMN07250955_10934 [Arboricoccus pini]|uniref:Lipoprotein n=1 Tax=Arboricoccus pini TaxID=1963835 RepID=A0A212RI83_9PROT|nr:hypothetical protein [Arboricoccus pini]SNB72104.1 hypothetical protein SAMN07250955_10934 [Arboricoccus pini]